MRRAVGLAMALVVGLAGTVLAGAMYRNDSGAVARAVRIEFSEPAEITSMWPSFPQRDPQGPATVVVLSGGELPAGGWFSLTWRPDTARVVKIEWFGSPPSSARPNVGFSDPKPKPEVHGELLNPAFFAHPAYVMQGVSERDKVFALPLQGVPELSFYPVLGDLPASSLTWKFEVSHPEGIGAAVEDGTLYVWGSNSEWQGYGAVELHVSTPDGRSGWVVIPVVVFCSDRTLVNPQGKKDYFVPWGVILDINRILSTEEHMRQYSKPDLGLLDRTLRFSRWRLMEVWNDIYLMTAWYSEIASQGSWPQAKQFALVDVLLSELAWLGVTGIRIWNQYFIQDRSATSIAPLYGHWHPTKRPSEEAYIANEAHRLGMVVMIGNFVAVGDESGGWAEIFEASPSPMTEFLRNFTSLNSASLERWVRLGVDIVDLCPELATLHRCRPTREQAQELSDGIVALAGNARYLYPGPIYHAAIHNAGFFPGRSVLEAPFWPAFDIIGVGTWGLDLTGSPTDEMLRLVDGWRRFSDQVLKPFHARYTRPVMMSESGCPPVSGCANYGHICSRMPSYDPARPSLEAMANYYRSLHQVLGNVDWCFSLGLGPLPLTPPGPGSAKDLEAIFRLKIEDVVQEMFLGEVKRRIIVLDGKLEDWVDDYLIGEDAIGDSRGMNDLWRLSFVEDEMYWYFRVDYTRALSGRGFLVVELDSTGDGVAEAILMLNNVSGEWYENEWIYPTSPGPKVGCADAIDTDNGLEIRVPKRFLVDLLVHQRVRVRLVHADSSWRVEDETGWFTLPQR